MAQTDKLTDGHCDLETEWALGPGPWQWANAVKTLSECVSICEPICVEDSLVNTNFS